METISTFFQEYRKNTAERLRIIDGFLLYILATGIIQFVYCALVGTFPFNSFLSGFICCVGVFILTVCLRLQVNPKNEFRVTPERAFADYLLCNIILFLVVFNFMG
eukprot:GILK01006995.1.p1 GENE.GILK01006995.1~~GILK01006995.1.p1  ORF type:complete len:119 (+),score=9.19 GILK01006995.1:41-358(+)